MQELAKEFFGAVTDAILRAVGVMISNGIHVRNE